MRYRWLVFALIVGVLAFVAAGCGGDDDGGGRRGQRGRHRRNLGNGDLERRGAGAFQEVIDGFNELYPNVNVKYTSGGDNLAPLLSTAVEGGNPPDIACDRPAGPDEGLRGAGRDPADGRPPGRDRRQLRRVGGRRRLGRRHAVRGHVQGGEQVDDLVQRAEFEEAGVEPPETWDELNEAATR